MEQITNIKWKDIPSDFHQFFGNDQGTAVCPENDVPRFEGRYVIMRRLGGGGMGTVFEAFDAQLKRIVVVKVMLPDSQVRNGALRSRIEEEARQLGRLLTPRVVSIFDRGEKAGLGYLIMPRLKGMTLEAKLNGTPGSCLSTKEILRLLWQGSEALHVVHANGIIHRDIKPSNIWLSEVTAGNQPDPLERPFEVVLIDFGLVREEGFIPRHSNPKRTMGTPCYMAKEQLAGKAVSKSDLFSFGITLFEAATGHTPFVQSDHDSRGRIKPGARPRLVSRLNPSLPHWISDLVASLLKEDFNARPSALDLLHALKVRMPFSPDLALTICDRLGPTECDTLKKLALRTYVDCKVVLELAEGISALLGQARCCNIIDEMVLQMMTLLGRFEECYGDIKKPPVAGEFKLNSILGFLDDLIEYVDEFRKGTLAAFMDARHWPELAALVEELSALTNPWLQSLQNSRAKLLPMSEKSEEKQVSVCKDAKKQLKKKLGKAITAFSRLRKKALAFQKRTVEALQETVSLSEKALIK